MARPRIAALDRLDGLGAGLLGRIGGPDRLQTQDRARRGLASFADYAASRPAGARTSQDRGLGRTLGSYEEFSGGRRLGTFDQGPEGEGSYGRRVNDPYGGAPSKEAFEASFQLPQVPGVNGGAAVGPISSGGSYAHLDAHNPEVASSASKYGVPANLLKSMLIRESSGNWEANNYKHYARGSYMYPFVGVFADAARSVGFDPEAMNGNKQMQVDAMAAILARDYQTYGSWEAAMSNYFTGDPNAYLTGAGDPEGTLAAYGGATYYVGQAIKDWRAMDALGPSYAAGTSTPNYWSGSQAQAGNRVVAEALKYVGVDYIWGSVPGKGTNPWQTGWDCSGFTYWLDQNYGSGQLPMGSHYQYDYAIKTGRLTRDPSRLQPGDLMFFDTGWQGGGGAHLNNAGHVGVYIGNGQMVHASSASTGTIVTSISDPYYQGRFLGSMAMPWSGGGAAAYGGPAGGAAGGAYSGSAGSPTWQSLFARGGLTGAM